MRVRKRTLSSNKDGFTLIEVLIAMVILTIGLLGFLQGVNIAMEHNLKTLLRNEAASLAEQQMSALRLVSYDSLADTTYGAGSESVSSSVRGKVSPFKVRREIVTVSNSAAGTSSKQMKVLVSWTYRNLSTHYYEVSSLRSN